jgi:hypothetical protein
MTSVEHISATFVREGFNGHMRTGESTRLGLCIVIIRLLPGAAWLPQSRDSPAVLGRVSRVHPWAFSMPTYCSLGRPSSAFGSLRHRRLSTDRVHRNPYGPRVSPPRASVISPLRSCRRCLSSYRPFGDELSYSRRWVVQYARLHGIHAIPYLLAFGSSRWFVIGVLPVFCEAALIGVETRI